MLLGAALALLDQELVGIFRILARHERQHAHVTGRDRHRVVLHHPVRIRVDDVAARAEDVRDDAPLALFGDHRILGEGLAEGADLDADLPLRNLDLVDQHVIIRVGIAPVPAFGQQVGLNALVVGGRQDAAGSQIVSGLADQHRGLPVLDDHDPRKDEDPQEKQAQQPDDHDADRPELAEALRYITH